MPLHHILCPLLIPTEPEFQRRAQFLADYHRAGVEVAKVAVSGEPEPEYVHLARKHSEGASHVADPEPHVRAEDQPGWTKEAEKKSSSARDKVDNLDKYGRVPHH